MDVELWIFITAACLFSCCLGSACTYYAVNWSRDRQEEADQQRRENAIEHGLRLAQENQQLEQRISGDTPAVLYDQDAPEQVKHGIDPADYFGIRVDVPRQPPAMTGERDVDAQDRELTDIYGIDRPPVTEFEHSSLTDDEWLGYCDGAGIDPGVPRCGWSDGGTVCGDPAAGAVTWPEGPVDLCATHLAWVRENEDAPVVSD